MNKAEVVSLARREGFTERTIERSAQRIHVTRNRVGQGKNHRAIWKLG
jgi:hypothetical protein